MRQLKLIYLILFITLVSCSNDDVDPSLVDWDCAHYVVFIDIQDADGNNLFSDDYHGIVSLDSITPVITYTYKGETHPVCYLKSEGGKITPNESRALYYDFYGVYVAKWYFTDKHPQICFGEFVGTKDHNESVTLNWPDGTHSKIELTARAVKLNGPYHYMKTRLDDGEWVEVDSGSTLVTIVK